jgi:hypothetical protein
MVYTGIKTVLVTDFECHINLFNENLDLALFPEGNDQRRLAEFLHTKYASEHIDAIIAVTFPALSFVLRHKEKLFPGVPVVFCALNVDDLSRLGRMPDVTGVATTVKIAETIDIA